MTFVIENLKIYQIFVIYNCNKNKNNYEQGISFIRCFK